MQPILQILATLLFLLRLQRASCQYVEPRLCDGVCYCSSEDAVVDCSPQDRIRGIPTNLPPGTRKLVIQGGVFSEPGHLSSKNLSGLAHLVSLRIVNSQLRSIESRAFLGMTSLRDLDLSLNQLQRIEPHTFYGLNLKTLYLQEQRLQPDPYNLYGSMSEPEPLVLTNEALYGLSASRIDLRRNSMSDISFSLFSKVNGLEKLILSNNRIRQLDPKFADYFDKSTRLIDLTDNPLQCSCALAWLVNRVKEWVIQSPTIKTTCLIDPRIGGPGSKVELQKLSPNHLCMASRIKTIGVDITPAGKAATLSCTAVAFNRMNANGDADDNPYSDMQQFINHPVVRMRPPSVAWKYVESGQIRQVTGMPSDLPQTFEHTFGSGDEQKTMTTVQLNVSLSQASRKFTCITWDEKKDDQEVLVTIRGPSQPPLVEVKDDKGEGGAVAVLSNGKPDDSKDGGAKAAGGGLAYAQSSFLFQKQYTLLEMIGAVIGTFLVTLIVLLVGSRCLLLLKHRTMSNHMSKDVGGRLSTYDSSATKQPDAMGSGLNTASRVPGSSSNGHIQTQGYDGITAYPLYNHYLAQTSAVTYPTHLGPAASMVTSPTTGQLMPISATTPLLQSNMMVPGLPPGQPLAYWPAPPGSAYSGGGSHEYDIPRAMETSQIASEATTIPRDHQIGHSTLPPQSSVAQPPSNNSSATDGADFPTSTAPMNM